MLANMFGCAMPVVIVRFIVIVRLRDIRCDKDDSGAIGFKSESWELKCVV